VSARWVQREASSTWPSTAADIDSLAASNARIRTGRRVGLNFRITASILRVMQAPAPPLLPLLRSRLQAELLTLVLLTPDREWTLTELAHRVGGSVSSAQREMARAEQTGVVKSRRLGHTRLVVAADSPLTEPLTELLLRSFGPRQVLTEAIAQVEGIEAAYLFGSWAARYAGKEGRAPADLDVLVIGKPDRDELDEVAQRAGARLAREVNVTIRSPQWWRDGGDPFHTEVTHRPLIPILEHREKLP
jgi:predicted nucleotidyltransferase